MRKSMKNLLSKIFLTILCLGTFYNLSAQSNVVASLNFDPKIDGFGFKNYKNEGEKWKDDIAVDDLIRMFGADSLCKKRSRAKKCVEKADPRPWIDYYLKLMNIGHCEGIAVASLRMNSGLPFKKRTSPANFQTGAKSPFSLRREQTLENYIAYYWITQTFDEISIPTKETADSPVELAKTLINSMNAKTDTYLLGFYKYDKGRPYDGHAVAPFAVEDTGNQYKIYVYDNNFPGETRYLYVNKNAAESWYYSSKADPKAKPDYFGEKKTKTLELTANSWRDNRCFDPPFDTDSDTAEGCGKDSAIFNRPFFTTASFQPRLSASDEDGEDAEFFLTGEGNLLVSDGEDRIGYDQNNRFYDEIQDGNFRLLIGGLGIDLPHYTIPYNETGEPYTIVFSGKNLTEESALDFVFSAPGFTVGFDGIKLDPNETLTATVSRDGEQITFKASAADAETPEVFFAFDPENDEEASYIATIGGVELTRNKTLTYEFDFENGKLFMSDDDGNEDNYDIELIRINADGTEPVYEQEDLNIGKADKYEMDFGDWDGKGSMCFKDDEDSDGFDDEQCSEQPNEDDGIDEY